MTDLSRLMAQHQAEANAELAASEPLPDGVRLIRLDPIEQQQYVDRRTGPRALGLNPTHALYRIGECQQITRGKGARVGIVDTGCDVNHPDLRRQGLVVWVPPGAPYDNQDHHGHGTHCAGIVGCAGADQAPVGVAPEVELLSYKGLGDTGSGRSDYLAAGIRQAVADGCDVISCSFGADSTVGDIEEACQYAVSQGRAVCVAAGNDGPQDGTVGWPGKLPAVWTVGATDNQGTIASFSSRGPEVDGVTPGVQVLSTYPGGRFSVMSGTSMATPFASGVVALVVSALRQGGKPGATGMDAVRELDADILGIGTPTPNHVFGRGRWQPFLTLTRLAKVPTPPAPPAGTYLIISLDKTLQQYPDGIKIVR